jgi:hypothetical protein
VFREISAVKQVPGEPFRRWFSSASMDLFVWTNDADEIVSYQLSYNKPRAEKALTWRAGQGFCHDDVDEGSRPGKHPASPILLTDGYFDAEHVLAMFKENAASLDETLKAFIVSGINNHFKPDNP